MTDSQNDDSMNELSARLDEIFGVDDEETDDAGWAGGESQKSPLQELNTTVLTLEWEITDEMVVQLLDQVEELKETFKDDYFAYSLLRLLGSVGKYVRTRKAAAHPSALNLLNSLHTNLVKVVESSELTKKDKNALLQAEVKKFKRLKQVISEEKEGRSPGKAAEPQQRAEPEAPEPAGSEQPAAGQISEPLADTAASGPDIPFKGSPGGAGGHSPPGEAGPRLEGDLASAVEEIKKTIREEFQALREDIRAMKDER